MRRLEGEKVRRLEGEKVRRSEVGKIRRSAGRDNPERGIRSKM